MLVSNIRNIIEAQGINILIKNEFAQGAVGELSVTDSWPEIWVVNDEEYARTIEICWNCQSGNT